MIKEILDIRPHLGHGLKERHDQLKEIYQDKSKAFDVDEALDILAKETEQAYIEVTMGDYETILEDAQQLIEPLEKEDCETVTRIKRKYIELLMTEIDPLKIEANDSFSMEKRRLLAKTYASLEEQIKKLNMEFDNAYNVIISQLRIIVKTLDRYELNKQEIQLMAAKKAAEWYEIPEDWEGALENDTLPMSKIEESDIATIVFKEVESILYPLDKINSDVWRDLSKADKNGQITFRMEPKGSKKPALAYFGINFDDLTDIRITRKLTSFDKRVYIAAVALFNGGNAVFTLTQLHYVMGNTSRPSQDQLKAIYDSITKMSCAHIYLSNERAITDKDDKGTTPQSEAVVLKNRKAFNYDSSLLPMERVAATVNGKFSDAAIHLFREPPLFSFARDRGQITTLDPLLLKSPVRKTERNLAIDDYLMERIVKMKSDKKRKGEKKKSDKHEESEVITKILYDKIFENCHISGTMPVKRAKDTIEKYLQYYKHQKFINGYKKLGDGVDIEL